MYETPKVCMTTGGNSQVVCKSFALGCKTKPIALKSKKGFLVDDSVATYGILRGSGKALKHSWEQGHDCWYIDHAYFGKSKVANRGGLHGYFRIVHNNKSKDMFRVIHDIQGDFPSDRLDSFNLDFKDWRGNGSEVVVVPPSNAMGPYLGISPPEWIHKVKEEIKKYTDRKIVVCQKQKGRPSGLKEYLKTAWVLITDHSNCQIDALVNGVPVITTSEMRKIGSIKEIENPIMDRGFLKNLAYKQWSRAEMESGKAWRELNDFTQ
jgi:hypothetical protein